MTHPIITSMIVECRACGKIHESLPVVIPISDEVTAVFFSCSETHSLFMSDKEKHRLDVELERLKKEEQKKAEGRM